MKELAQSFDGKRHPRRYKKIRRVKTERTMCYMNGTRAPRKAHRESGQHSTANLAVTVTRLFDTQPAHALTERGILRRFCLFRWNQAGSAPSAIGTHRNRASVRVSIIPCSYVFVKHFFAIAKKKHPCCSICGGMKAGDGKISVHLRIFGNFPAYVAIADREE